MTLRTSDGRVYTVGFTDEFIYFIIGTGRYAFEKKKEQAYLINWLKGDSVMKIEYLPVISAALPHDVKKHYDAFYRDLNAR